MADEAPEVPKKRTTRSKPAAGADKPKPPAGGPKKPATGAGNKGKSK